MAPLKKHHPLHLHKHFSPGARVIIVITFVLFTVALFSHGFTKTLLLEAGVFLISVKLMLMAYRTSVIATELDKKLVDIQECLKRLEEKIK